MPLGGLALVTTLAIAGEGAKSCRILDADNTPIGVITDIYVGGKHLATHVDDLTTGATFYLPPLPVVEGPEFLLSDLPIQQWPQRFRWHAHVQEGMIVDGFSAVDTVTGKNGFYPLKEPVPVDTLMRLCV